MQATDVVPYDYNLFQKQIIWFSRTKPTAKNNYVACEGPPVTTIFNKELSPEEYNEWIVRNGYSKQIPLEVQISGKDSSENGPDNYVFFANAYSNPNNRHGIAESAFYARAELKDETWPLFEHFVRLLMDPFIYNRSLTLYSPKVLSLLAEAMNSDRNRLQCNSLDIRLNGDTQKFIVWVKNRAHCDKFYIYVASDSNYDEEMLDLFLTGAPCTSAINVINYDPSKVIVDLVQKFIGLKNCDVVESVQGNVKGRGIVEKLKRNCAKFIAEEKFEEGLGTRQVIQFINSNIEKKLTLDVTTFSFALGSFSIKIANL